ncbi:MAG: pyridoxal phosphate-dependent aminotransferase [Candidatus Eremiobacteraeota bacterium]|nr:pyridoxal phosphate-dependent aminotransferase [Candidatus Eremiobacteraeota bacterium]MBC5803685.1 pyridoxal phosphate-dependent aminotransferase [Candidatus Eremiobacteraeota bacterium]MBC5821183.1 pyridoxal phosphate-dependent aminotransferase [Candidatus Eremiobacteraeota bacterium]
MITTPLPESAAVSRLGRESAFEVLARARELEAQGHHVVHLEIGEPDFNTPEHIKRAAIAAIEGNESHYTPSAGIADLRDTVAAYAAKLRGMAPFAREEVVITPGAKPLIWNTLSALLDPGDEMVYADPAYPAYASCASYLGANAIAVPLLERTGFRLDLDELAARISPRTKLLVINSPHNPTGGVLTREDLETIAELAIRNDVLVIADEIYCRNLYDGDFVSIASLPEMRERTIIVDGFSKAYAMTGWRLGYGIMPAHIARNVTLFNNNTFSCVATFVQHAGIEALEGPDEPVKQMVEEFRVRRDAIVAGLNSIPGVTCQTPAGAFYVFPNVSRFTTDDKALATYLLDDAHVAGLAGSSFGAAGRGYLRFSYAASLEHIATALDRLRTALPRFKG